MRDRQRLRLRNGDGQDLSNGSHCTRGGGGEGWRQTDRGGERGAIDSREGWEKRQVERVSKDGGDYGSGGGIYPSASPTQ